MSDHEAFIREIIDRPGDKQVLHSYADWLESQRDSRARYLRLCCVIRNTDIITVEHLVHYREFHELRRTISPEWLDRTNLWLIETMPLEDSVRGADDGAIQEFEDQLQVKLTDDYRGFLKTHNGGAPFELRKIADQNEVNWFYEVEDGYQRSGENSSLDLATTYDFFMDDWLDERDIWARKPLPIASTSRGDVCLICEGSDRGRIYIFDDHANSFHPHAKSFTEFVVGLQLCSFERMRYEPTPFLRAIQVGDRKLFLEEYKKEFLEEANSLGMETPLLCALAYSRLDMTQFLLAAGARVDRQRKSRECAMDLAAQRGEAYVSLLLKQGADPNGVDESRSSPLFWAIMNQRDDACRLLVQHGARLETRDAKFKTVREALEYKEMVWFEKELKVLHKNRGER